MGFFDAFFGGAVASRVKLSDDQIWISHAARYRGVTRELSALATADTDAIFVIAHFSDVLDVLRPIVESSLVTIPKMAVLAEQLSPAMAEWLGLVEEASIDLIVAERHPLVRADEAVLEFARRLRCKARVRYHLSLEDVVMRQFGGEWVRKALMRLGMTEEEAIESKMVSVRLKASQMRFQSTIRSNQPAASAEEWMRLNGPEAMSK